MMAGRRGSRCKQILDDLKETRGYWKLKEEAIDRTVWITGFGRGYKPVVRERKERMNEARNAMEICFYAPHIPSWRAQGKHLLTDGSNDSPP
jgi:hypothetical protein